MKKWWKKAVFYEIYMPSFCDGNGDGIGDFKGIIKKLDYLKELGISGLWLTPFYRSPKVDNGYDIEDYYTVDPDYGTMEDFKEFLCEAHKRGIRVIADLVLNHTSSKHIWFTEAKASKNSPKRDWYIWRTAEREPPNNWESFFSGSAWEYDEDSNEYYYHAFAKEQVDLNWSNQEVKKAMFEVIKFWLELGIDGFRLDVINFLKTDKEFIDNPYDEKGKQIHIYDKDQKKVIDVIKELRSLVKVYGDKFLVGEIGSEELGILMKYTGEDTLDVVFNFNLGSIEKFDAEKIYSELRNMEENFKDKIPTLFFGSHDMSRFISRFSDETMAEEKAKLMAALMLTGKGVPFIYFGDEIGMRDFYPKHVDEMRDIQGVLAYEKALSEGRSEEEALTLGNKSNRDKSRTPMQWDESRYCGFSDVRPWIDIPKEWRKINVSSQYFRENSQLNYYRKLVKLRRVNEVLQFGGYKELNKKGDIIYFIREYKKKKVITILNFSKEIGSIKFNDIDLSNYDAAISSRRKDVTLEKEMQFLPFEAVVLVEKSH